MPRSSPINELVFDPEVKRTTRTNRNVKRQEENLPTLMLSTSIIWKLRTGWQKMIKLNDLNQCF